MSSNVYFDKRKLRKLYFRNSAPCEGFGNDNFYGYENETFFRKKIKPQKYTEEPHTQTKTEVDRFKERTNETNRQTDERKGVK